MNSRQPWLDSQAGHAYVAWFPVRFSDLDPLGHVNNAVYLNLMEQAAIEHAGLSGFAYDELRTHNLAFIARRHEITYVAPSFAGDWLRVTTWTESLEGARAIRAYEICRSGTEDSHQPGRFSIQETPTPTGDVVVSARTEWAFIDLTTGRPKRLPEGIEAAFLRT